jgi:hypothetical protein
MEADWEIEIGGQAPIIDVCWPGFVDLRLAPGRTADLLEVRMFPALADALVRLNAEDSTVWTSKCDVWPVAEIDPLELDALPDSALFALACYIDLLSRSDEQWPAPEAAVGWCKALCKRLRAMPLRSSRVDLVVRRAYIAPDRPNLGITAYLTACGGTIEEANSQLRLALAVFSDSVSQAIAPDKANSKLQSDNAGE